MTDSFRKIDYRLRPAKHAERRMLVDIAARLRFAPLETYRYVGLGSVAFVDCRMFHRAFGITDIVNIEGSRGDKVEMRFQQNKPFRCVDLRFGMSSEVLPSLDFGRPSIVWLDYDDQIQRSMANDLATVARTVAPGSLLIVTFGTSYPAPGADRDEALARLKSDFPTFLTHDEDAGRFEKDGLARFGRQVLGEILSKALADADAGSAVEKRRRAEQVCFFRYKDGAWMCTVGWVVVTDEVRPQFDAGAFDGLPFVHSTDKPIVINVPLITPHEVRELERHLPDNIEDDDVAWIPPRDRKAFRSFYRYLPNLAILDPI